MDEAELERLRESSGLRLDAQGRFWHRDSPVEHPRVVQAFRRGLGRAPDGRPIVRLGREWCYLRVDDVLFRATSATCEEEGGRLASCALTLDDDTQMEWVPREEEVALGEPALYLRVRGEWVRLLPSAHAALGAFVEGDPPVLRSTAGRIPIRARTAACCQPDAPENRSAAVAITRASTPGPR